METEVAKHRFTVEEFRKMGEAGIFGDDDQVGPVARDGREEGLGVRAGLHHLEAALREEPDQPFAQ